MSKLKRVKDGVRGKVTDEIGDVVAIGESSCWPASWKINSVRGSVCAGSSNQVVVVATVHK